MSDRVALELIGVSKSYPGTHAVRRVDFDVRFGEVHGLMGENGAGKSTLVKVIAGAFDDYTGTIHVGGEEVVLRSPAASRARGIEMIHQELNLSPARSVAENILCGRLPVRAGILLDTAAMIAEATRWLARVGLDLDPATPVGDLSPHEAQLVEIAKALSRDPTVLVMDEPTSSLGREEVSRLFGIVRRLRDEGHAVIYISHHLPEVFEVADRITVLRDGENVATLPVEDATAERVVGLMTGGAADALAVERRAEPREPRLVVQGLTRYGFFHDVSFEVRAGEVVGMCGLSGAGRSEVARSVCGIDPVDEGAVTLDGQTFQPTNLAAAMRRGVGYLTEDRKRLGLSLRQSVAENTLATLITRHTKAGIYLPSAGRALVERLLGDLRVHPGDPRREVAQLSGGNQQKVLLAKWLAIEPRVLLLDEPTRGVDIAAKVLIHQAIAELADSGCAILLISSDLPELIDLSDRVLVMRQGRVIGAMLHSGLTEQRLLLAMNGEITAA